MVAINYESTLVEEKFFHLINNKEVQKKNYRYVKLSLDEDTFIYTRINYDALETKKDRILIKTMNTI